MLFDVDGTLVDSSYLHSLAWLQAFRRDHDFAVVSDCATGAATNAAIG